MDNNATVNETAAYHTITIPGLIDEAIRFETISNIASSLQTSEIQSSMPSSSATSVRNRLANGSVQLAHLYSKSAHKLATWLMQSLDIDQALKRYQVVITTHAPDQPKQVVRQITLHDAFPTHWSGPILGSGHEQITLDILQLSYTQLTLGYVESTVVQPLYPTLSSSNGVQITLLSPPEQLQITQGSEYQLHAGPNTVKPHTDYQRPRARQLQMTWVEDWDIPAAATQENSVIYSQVDKLRQCLQLQGTPLQPSRVTFKYGQRSFAGYIVDLHTDVRKFSSQGVPLRVAYQLSMVEAADTQEASDAVF